MGTLFFEGIDELAEWSLEALKLGLVFTARTKGDGYEVKVTGF